MDYPKAHKIAKREKEEAMERSVNTDDIKKHHDSCQAVNAWDELLGQLHKHNGTKKKRFDKTKKTALRIVHMISDKKYRSEMTDKISALTLH
jgi:hypothetical protein